MVKNLYELRNKLNDEQACIDYLASYRWKDGKVKCVYCRHDKCYRIEESFDEVMNILANPTKKYSSLLYCILVVLKQLLNDIF